MGRHTPPKPVRRGPLKQQVQVHKLQHVYRSFVFDIAVKTDGSWKAVLGDKVVAKAGPYAGPDKDVGTILIDAEKAAHAAIEKSLPA